MTHLLVQTLDRDGQPEFEILGRLHPYCQNDAGVAFMLRPFAGRADIMIGTFDPDVNAAVALAHRTVG